MENQTQEFFTTLEQALLSGSTITISAITCCQHFAGVSLKSGKLHALRYKNKIGIEALTAFETLKIMSFSQKETLSSLYYNPGDNPVSNQDFLSSLGNRISINRMPDIEKKLGVSTLPPPLQERSKDPISTVDQTTAQVPHQLSYRGQPVPSTGVAKPTVTHSAKLKYRGQDLAEINQRESSPREGAAGSTPKLQYRGSNNNPFMRLGKKSK